MKKLLALVSVVLLTVSAVVVQSTPCNVQPGSLTPPPAPPCTGAVVASCAAGCKGAYQVTMAAAVNALCAELHAAVDECREQLERCEQWPAGSEARQHCVAGARARFNARTLQANIDFNAAADGASSAYTACMIACCEAQ